MEKTSNPQIDLAHKYIRYTNKNIFLTGKAGTGKTTFLHNIKKEEIKRMVVVAPTGVAAINAGGMTIHSFFQLSFGPKIPGQTQEELKKKRFNRKKINLIKSLDLLVIDEISMVRADLLDAIDEVLRRYRDYRYPFGGVQLLMVGDLHQLPPVVKREEQQLLASHYQTLYFFGSLALQKTNPITIELKHIYRQADSQFIQLLNNVRNNKLDNEVLELLNSRFRPDFKPADEEGYIILTSHNASAQKINKEKLDALSEKVFRYKAEIEGNFPPHSYPTDEVLEFKLGAQVMFVKNDLSQDKLYYNGKIGQIVKINKDSIHVHCKGDHFDIPVSPLEWHNMKYNLNEKSKELTEEVVGIFRQIPLKAAWAITIHKSQGLTFERAIIDAQAAFAHGQVYVALSRCKSFEGMVLRTKINPSSVRTDQVVKRYTKEADQNAPNEDHLEASKHQYQQALIKELFGLKIVRNHLAQLNRIFLENEHSLQGDGISRLNTLISQAEASVFSVSDKFQAQLLKYFNQASLPEDNDALQDRIKKASHYFSDQLKIELIPAAQKIPILTDNQAVKKTAKDKMEALQQALFTQNICFESSFNGFSTHLYNRTKSNAELDYQKSIKNTPRVKKEVISVPHPILNAMLVSWRKTTGVDLDVPLYRILSTKALIGIVNSLPTDAKNLKRVKGIGPKKVQQFGEEILEMVENYCTEKQIDTGLRNQFEEEEKEEIVKPKVSNTKEISFNLFKTGKTIDEIAKERGFVRTTIEGHLSHFIGSGDLSIYELIEKEKVEKLISLLKDLEVDTLSEIKAKVGDDYSYGEIRMVRAFMKA